MDPWQVLGVARGASPAEIKAAYRQLAKRHHPDVGGDPEQFKRIVAAYDAIRDGRVPEPEPEPAPRQEPPPFWEQPVGGWWGVWGRARPQPGAWRRGAAAGTASQPAPGVYWQEDPRIDAGSDEWLRRRYGPGEAGNGTGM